MTADELLNEALNLVNGSKYEDAIKAADAVIAAAPGSEQCGAAWFLKGIANENLQNNEAAITSYTEATKIPPS